MNFFAKAISAQLFPASPSSTQSRKCILLQALASLQQSSFFSSKPRNPGVAKTKEPSSILLDPLKSQNELKCPLHYERPGEIPFHSNVSNSVDLIGFVQCPVQFEALPCGMHVAKTVILSTLESGGLEGGNVALPFLSLPVVFKGDLAAMVKCHVKENDCLYVSGQLSGGHLSFVTQKHQMNVHLLVQTMNFVGNMKKKPVDKEDGSRISGMKKNNDVSVEEEEKGSKKGVTLYKKKTMSVDKWKDWRDLINNSKEWMDYRERKSKGTVNARYPDFKHIQSRVALWLANAPEWALPGLKGLEFKDSVPETKAKGKNHWKSNKK